MLGENPTDPLLAEAAKHGLAKDREGPFLLWVGNECYEGREVADIRALPGRAHALVKRFQQEDEEVQKHIRESNGK